MDRHISALGNMQKTGRETMQVRRSVKAKKKNESSADRMYMFGGGGGGGRGVIRTSLTGALVAAAAPLAEGLVGGLLFAATGVRRPEGAFEAFATDVGLELAGVRDRLDNCRGSKSVYIMPGVEEKETGRVQRRRKEMVKSAAVRVCSYDCSGDGALVTMVDLLGVL